MIQVKTARCRAGLGLVLGALAATTALATAGPAGPAEDYAEQLEKLRDEFDAAEYEVIKAQREAETDQELMAALELDPWTGFRERFDALAFEAAGTEAAAGAWATIFTNEFRYGERENAWEAFDVIVHDYPDSEELEPVVAMVGNVGQSRKSALEGLRFLVDTSDRKTVRAGSMFSLAKILAQEEATREQAFAYYRKIVAKYADVMGRRATFGTMATAALYEAENLQVGMAAPDFASIDETDTPFKLSDYKGKVVLLDFWGFW